MNYKSLIIILLLLTSCINNTDIIKHNTDSIKNLTKFSKKWWIKRLEAHKFMRELFLKNGLKYNNSFDFFISKLLSN